MMFSRPSASSRVEHILLVSLSNIGDIVLTFPVFDVLRETYPQARISVVVGPKGRGLLEENPHVHKLYIFDKHASFKDKWRWLRTLRAQSFDLVVDLRNSMIPFLVKSRWMSRPASAHSALGHMKEKHLRRLFSAVKGTRTAQEKYALYISLQEERSADKLLNGGRDYVVVAPGAADHRKRWSEEGFAELIDHLVNVRKVNVVTVGDKNDAKVMNRILKKAPAGVIDIAGRTDLVQLGAVLRRARLAVTNDSGIMHMASYLNIPVVALFGPTDPALYGPWSTVRRVVRHGRDMEGIQVKDVLSAVDEVFPLIK